jgi:propionyl-CoA carboxylase beta chain
MLGRYEKIRARMLAAGGADKVAAQHQKGKLGARERVELLVDKGSFVEQQPYVTVRATDFGVGEKKFLGDGVVRTSPCWAARWGKCTRRASPKRKRWP